MITVLFFAKYREQLGVGKILLSADDIDLAHCTVSKLKAYLTERGQVWAAVLNAENTLCAVNQDLAGDDAAVTAGDEVAFYPPVTGG